MHARCAQVCVWARMQAKAGLPWRSSLVLVVVLVSLQPGVLCGKLVCYFCAPTSVNKTCKHVLSECAARELCFTGDGRFGHAHLFLSKGCMGLSDCARPKTAVVRKNNVTFTYSCCGRNYCNASPRSALTGTAIAVSVFAVGWTALICY
ncbi:protein Bouncer [Pseudorasbora parva]|uniref:protein Bouncer n=1 Tax=Pseudorasbora parva TaxID=51549 RepID=UPI00351E7AD7